MIPTLQHTQPLFKDLSLQPKGRYLMTLYGINSRKYLYIDDIYVHERFTEAYRKDCPEPVMILPIGTMWTVVLSDVCEYPTLEEITRQAKLDEEGTKALQQALYESGEGETVEAGGIPVVIIPTSKSSLPVGQYL